jgi:hypothetical protein
VRSMKGKRRSQEIAVGGYQGKTQWMNAATRWKSVFVEKKITVDKDRRCPERTPTIVEKQGAESLRDVSE